MKDLNLEGIKSLDEIKTLIKHLTTTKNTKSC